METAKLAKQAATISILLSRIVSNDLAVNGVTEFLVHIDSNRIGRAHKQIDEVRSLSAQEKPQKVSMRRVIVWRARQI